MNQAPGAAPAVPGLRDPERQRDLPRRPPPDAKPKDRATLRRESSALDSRFVHRMEVPEKVLVQAELAYMRNQLDRDRRTVDVTYPVNPPYAFVHVAFDVKKAEFSYTVLEPSLKEGEPEKVRTIREKMEAMMSQEEIPVTEGLNLDHSPELQEYLRSRFLSVLDLYDIDVPAKRRPVLLYYLLREFIGLGRTDPVLRDPFLEDVSCLGPGVPLYVFHRVFGSMRTNVEYGGELELNKYILRLAQISGKHISIYQPILDATLRDGSRINLTLGTEVTRKGSTFSVRKFSQDPVSPIDLLRFGSVSSAQMAYFWTLVEAHRSILISGGTASGKTTLLNAICMFVRPEDKIVSIEDTPEIHIDHQNWIQSIARSGYGMPSGLTGASGISGISHGTMRTAGSVTLFDLLVAALRQRPEYVIVGEVRGTEAFTLFQAISVGHASMSTIHAGTIGELLHRVENEPMNIPRVLFQALDMVAFPAQVAVRDQRVRRVMGMTEILEVDAGTNELLTNDVFRWQPGPDSFTYLGRSFVLEKISTTSGRSLDELTEEMRRKARYLEMMSHLGVTYYKDVAQTIAAYYVDAAAATRQLERRIAR
nr:type II/IV secretion system ATPase subunit [Thermoplasmata archaeon]